MKKYFLESYSNILDSFVVKEVNSYKEGLKESKGKSLRFYSVDECGEEKEYFNRISKEQQQQNQEQNQEQQTPSPIEEQQNQEQNQEQQTPSPIEEQQNQEQQTPSPIEEQQNQEQNQEQQTPSLSNLRARDLSSSEKTNLRKLGSNLQKEFESLKGFARAIENEMFVFGVCSPYFEKIYKEYLSLFVDFKVQKGLKGEQRKAAERAAAAEKGAYINTEYSKRDTKTLESSTIFRVLSSANLIFGFCRANLVRFYGEKSANSVTLAKVQKIAQLKSNLLEDMTNEEYNVLLKTKKEYTINGLVYVMSEKTFNDIFTPLNGVVRREVREDFGEVKEQHAIWKAANGDLCALVPKTKFGFVELLPVLCRVSLRAKNTRAAAAEQHAPSPIEEQQNQEQQTPSQIKKGEDVFNYADKSVFVPFSVTLPKKEQNQEQQNQEQHKKNGSLRNALNRVKKLFEIA